MYTTLSNEKVDNCQTRRPITVWGLVNRYQMNKKKMDADEKKQYQLRKKFQDEIDQRFRADTRALK